MNINKASTPFSPLQSGGLKDTLFRSSLTMLSVVVVVLFILILLTLVYQSFPSIREFGARFYASSKWDMPRADYGSLSFMVGTLITSLLALLISLPFSLMISIFLGEYFKEGTLSNILKSMIELLAGIPSIVYGLWGMFVFVPFIRGILNFLYANNILYETANTSGRGMFTAATILAVMIIPYSASIGREVISLVPNDLKEAGYAMGGTRFEVIKKVILPYCKSGIFAGVLLALGRALGETMAVTMVIGNRNAMPTELFSNANTLASVIALEFSEAERGSLHLSSLIHLGLVLFIITAVINIIGKKVVRGIK